MNTPDDNKPYRSGYVNIIGKPNVGKSTLMNALVGERMSIISHKPQTTRHRILGILSGDDYQMVFSDTPGYIKKPNYRMHEAMNRFVEGTLEDADVLLCVVDATDLLEEDSPVLAMLKKATVPIVLVINKIDLVDEAKQKAQADWWQAHVALDGTYFISARIQQGVPELLEGLIARLPEGPAYFPPDQLTDRPERFFVSEIIREQIFNQYSDEVPYSCEVGIESYKETTTKTGEPLARIYAVIFVMRDTQRVILLGKNGDAIKKMASTARLRLEHFLQTKVFLEVTVKVRDNWRDDDNLLKRFGYST
jgi:GTPase